MGYCSQSDLEKRFTAQNVARWASDGQDILDEDAIDAIDQAIERAAAETDFYLAQGGHSVPLASVPTLIKHLNIDMAGFHLAGRRGFAGDRGPMAAATLLGGYQRAIQLLESFAEGKPLPGLAAAESGIASTTEDREPTFSRLSFDKGDGSLLDDDMDGTLEGF